MTFIMYQVAAAIIVAAVNMIRCIATEVTICQRGAAVDVVVHPAAVVGSVVREYAILKRGAAAVVVHPAAVQFFGASVASECAIYQRGTTINV